MKNRFIAAFLVFALIFLPLTSCGKKSNPPQDEEPDVYAAAERLLTWLRTADSFSLDGSYSSGVGGAPSLPDVALTDTGRVLAVGSVEGGSLTASLTLSGSRTENGTETDYEESYALSGGLLSDFGSGETETAALASLLPLAETAESIEALLGLLPLLSEEISSELLSAGIGYGAEDLLALFGELASLYRLLTMRLGQGQLLSVPSFSGDAADALAGCGRVTVDEHGTERYVFSLLNGSALPLLLNRAALLCQMPLGELIDRLAGEGSAERLSREIAFTPDGETLNSLLGRLARVLFGVNAEAEALLSVLHALSVLTDAEEISDTLADLSDTDAVEALRMLTGDPALSPSDAGSLVCRLLSLSLDGMLASIGAKSGLSQRLSDVGEAVGEGRLSISFPCREAEMPSLLLSVACSRETPYGYCSTVLSLTLTLTAEK